MKLPTYSSLPQQCCVIYDNYQEENNSQIESFVLQTMQYLTIVPSYKKESN